MRPHFVHPATAPTRQRLRATLAAPRLGALLAFLLWTGTALAGSPVAPDPAPDHQPPCRARAASPEGRPRIGVALGGGGARGIAHISVLRELEAMHIPIDCISGTSMGALVGALYASGMSLDEIEALVLGMDWERMFSDRLERPEQTFRRKRDDDLVVSQPGVGIGKGGVRVSPGLLAGERILLTFSRLIEPVASIEHFDDLPIPFRAVAADINTGEAVVLSGGNLAQAMRASMSIPGVFPPVEIGGRLLVDGGVADNLPVDAVRDMGADVVIAVNVGTPLSQIGADASVLKVADQLVGLLTVRNTQATIASLQPGDILIAPPLGDQVATADFTKGKQALAIGLEGVAPVRDRLATLGVNAADDARNRSVRTGRQTQPPTVAFVRLVNTSRYSDAYILDRVDVPIGQPLDSARLEEELFGLYGSRTLALATYEVLEEDGRTGVVLHVKPKVQGPNYIELGLSMSSDYEGRSDFGVRLGILGSPFNDSGGEWRALVQFGDEMQLLGEVYQPFGQAGRWFAAGRVAYSDRKIDTFSPAGDKLNQFKLSELGASVGMGREFGNFGAAYVGIRRARGEGSVLIGDPTLPSFDFNVGEAFAEVSVDRLDSLFFPRDGYFIRNRLVASREALGADTDFLQYDLDAMHAFSVDRHSFQWGVRAHTTVSGTAPLQSLYRLGGFTRLVGFQPNELSGQHYGVLLGGYNFRIAKVVDQPALVGLMLEYGNVWNRREDVSFTDGILNGSLYIGLDSWIGPILFGVGAREGGERNMFFELGHRF